MEASSSSVSRSPAVLGTIKSPTLSSFSRSRASASPAWLSSESSILSPHTSSPTMPALNRAPPAVGSWENQAPHVAPAVTTATDDDAAEVTTAKPKLRPLRWDKLKASSDRAMVWDQMKSSSFRLNEKMFVCNATPTPKGVFKKPGIPSAKEDTRVLDPKKSQSIAILLRALNVTKEEVCGALLEGNMENLSIELLETLVKITLTKEEEIKLKDYHDDSPIKLGPAERFLKAVIDIPFAFKRIDAMLYIANFDSEVKYLQRSFETLENACEELRNSRIFHKLLEAVLMTSNRMNVGTIRGVAHAFKLDTLLKLVDIRGTDGKTTLLHFVVQEIIQLEGSRIVDSEDHTVDSEELRKIGLQVVAGLSSELTNVKKAARMDSNVLGGYVSKLAGGIGKIREVLGLSESTKTQGSSLNFSQSMSNFLNKAEEEITRIQAHQSVALSLVKEMIEYFHGDISKEEAHLFRLFMVVRDFLDILDGVCREVGIINQKTNISSARGLTVPVHPISIFPVLPSYVRSLDSSENDDSPSS